MTFLSLQLSLVQTQQKPFFFIVPREGAFFIPEKWDFRSKNEGITRRRKRTRNTLWPTTHKVLATKDMKLTIIRSIYELKRVLDGVSGCATSTKRFQLHQMWPFHWISLSSINSGVVYSTTEIKRYKVVEKQPGRSD